MQDFYEIDLWNLEPYGVAELNYKQTAAAYKEVVNKMSADDFKRLRVNEYWKARDLYPNKYKKMKLLIYCYLMDKEGELVNWERVILVAQRDRDDQEKMNKRID